MSPEEEKHLRSQVAELEKVNATLNKAMEIDRRRATDAEYAVYALNDDWQKRVRDIQDHPAISSEGRAAVQVVIEMLRKAQGDRVPQSSHHHRLTMCARNLLDALTRRERKPGAPLEEEGWLRECLKDGEPR